MLFKCNWVHSNCHITIELVMAEISAMDDKDKKCFICMAREIMKIKHLLLKEKVLYRNLGFLTQF